MTDRQTGDTKMTKTNALNIRIESVLDTGTTYLVHCTAYHGDSFFDTFDCFYSQEYDTAIVVPGGGDQVGSMMKVEGVENLIALRVGGSDWARTVATAVVTTYLGWRRGQAITGVSISTIESAVERANSSRRSSAIVSHEL
jgi:hypothetical protein